MTMDIDITKDYLSWLGVSSGCPRHYLLASAPFTLLSFSGNIIIIIIIQFNLLA
jgi:hypothetical protein